MFHSHHSDDSQVLMFGDNQYGQLGVPTSKINSTEPVAITRTLMTSGGIVYDLDCGLYDTMVFVSM